MGTEDLVSRIIFFILVIPPLSDSHHKFRIVGIRMPIKRRIWCQDLKHVLPPLKPHHVQTFFRRRWSGCGMANQFRNFATHFFFCSILVLISTHCIASLVFR